MANCIKCGRKMPGLSFGKVNNVCVWCREYEAAQARGDDDDAVQRVMPKPWEARSIGDGSVTKALLGINGAVFIGMLAAGVSLTSPLNQQLIHWGANFGPLTLGGQWWRLVTCVFVHIGIVHIALNMWCLWSLGNMAEGLYGRWTFAAIYLTCGVGASVTSLAWNSGRISAGASGAIFGIAGALIATLKLGSFSAPSAMVRSSLKSVVTFAAYNLIFGAVAGRIDNSAHIGGLVTGLILGALIAWFAHDSSNHVGRFTVIAAVALIVAASAGLLFKSKAYTVHTSNAMGFVREGKLDDAIKEATIAVRQKPDSLQSHRVLAWVLTLGKRYPEAESEFKRILQLDPHDALARGQLAEIYLKTNRPSEAKTQLAAAIKDDPKESSFYIALGMTLAAEGDHHAAIAEFKKAVALNDQEPETYYRMGLSYANLGMYDDAIAALLKTAELAPDDHDTQLVLAKAFEAKGMKKEAEAALAKAEQLKPKAK